MVIKTEVERLQRTDRSELLELYTRAFAEHPLVPAFTSRPEATREVMQAFLDYFGGREDALLCGIRRDGGWACASVSVDSTREGSAWALLRFIFSLSRALGWRGARDLGAVHSEEPKYEERYLELVILGTLPAHQRQGLGRRMLQFLYDEARRSGYKGITLVADRDTPAFRFYIKEGFRPDREFQAGATTLCWMRHLL
jgi:GNAT superfamily N-acetyltransferase